MARRLSAASATLIVILMVTSTLGVLGLAGSAPAAAPGGNGTAVTIQPSTPAVTSASSAPVVATAAPTIEPVSPSVCSSLTTASNDPDYASFVNNVQSIASGAVASGLPASSLHLPYTGPIPAQNVNGVTTSGEQLDSECPQLSNQTLATSQTDPPGVNYVGQNDTNGVVRDNTIESNSVAAILTVSSDLSFYPASGTPTQWGAQQNQVLVNVTIFGQRSYDFWTQNVISYDSNNDTISFVDDTWNFTTGSSEMQPSSLVSWSPTGGSYTGVWVAYSPYYYCPPPFTVTAYVNTSVNAAGDQVLWYNYSLHSSGPGGQSASHGSYDYLIFNSQPKTGPPIVLTPPDFEASGRTSHEVRDTYEFDAFIGADDGSDQLDLNASASMQVQYCTKVPFCTPTSFSYANVPAATNVGTQTGEQTVGIAVNFVGATGLLSGGPLISHSLWNYTAQTGVNSGAIAVNNAISVSGSPLAVVTQPYFFVFFESTNYTSQGYQWAPDVPQWFLMPGTYNYQIMLADYTQQNGSIKVSAAPVTLSVVLPYNPLMGVYTPLWAFNNGQFAGISTSGAGTLLSQYIPFNNPTTHYFGFTPANLSANFYSSNDYTFSSFTGILFHGTSAYVDINAPVSFCVHASGSTYYYLGIELFATSHVTLSHDSLVRGWPAWTEISFYITVPASQNPAPQADVFVWNSTNDLILSNTFIGTAPTSGHVAPTELVLFGGTDNVVWGNTFRDPNNVVPSVTGSYGGIGLGESGDMIYNNNFTIDNPVVYLPYNWGNVADCLPQTLGGCANDQAGNAWYYNIPGNVVGNTWNVLPQLASNVANTVNGFPLSGNVLGTFYPTQGGNYYWNYGTSPNNYTTNPYVSRFYYSDWSNIFPLGCGTAPPPTAPCNTAPAVVGAYQNGITARGDYSPLMLALSFREVGLPAGTSWTVTLTLASVSTSLTSTSSSITFASLQTGSYTYAVSSIAGHTVSPQTGAITMAGPQAARTITFSAATYTVSIRESGVPSGQTFMLTVGAQSNLLTTNGGTDTLAVSGLANGTYSYRVADISGWRQATILYSGSIVVNGGANPIGGNGFTFPTTLAYTQVTYTVTIRESGLPSAKTFMLTVGSQSHSVTTNGGTDTLTVGEFANGTFSYSLAGISGWHQTTAPYSGMITVNGGTNGIDGTGNGYTFPTTLAFSPVTYTVTFTETGMPPAAGGGVAFNGGGTAGFGGGGVVAFSGLVNGSYGYAITAGAGYGLVSSAPGSPVTVNGANVPVTVRFAAGYSVTFTQTGLPPLTTWSVTLNGVPQSGTGGSIVFTGIANGTYWFTVSTTGYSANPASGWITVSGGAASQAIGFTSSAYMVTFTESGLRPGVSWSVTLGSSTLSALTPGSITFSVAAGTYTFQVGAQLGYTASPLSGTIHVVGGPVSQAIRFTLKPAAPLIENGLASSSVMAAGVPRGPSPSPLGPVSGYTSVLRSAPMAGVGTFRT